MSKNSSKLIQHLGIVAGICDEVKLIQQIDQRIPPNKREVSVGQAVQAMILNALGLSGRAVYLTPRFYKSRPTETLVGEGITADKLNAASLGTALDRLFDYGITELFFSLASQILKNYGIETRFAHLDSTTFSLHGQYNSKDEKIPEGVVHITKGYSKDNAPELNQVVAQLICSNRTSIPLWIETLSGNTCDKKSFPKTVKKFQKQFKSSEMPYMVMDSAFYTKENLRMTEGIKWITRVPETLKDVKNIYNSIDKSAMIPMGNGYAYSSVQSTYGGITQRWLVVFSQQACYKQLRTFEKNLANTHERNAIDLKHLKNQPFSCEMDALSTAERFSGKLRYQTLSYRIVRKDVYKTKDVLLRISLHKSGNGILLVNFIQTKRLSPRQSRTRECLLWQPVSLIQKFSVMSKLSPSTKTRGYRLNEDFVFSRIPIFMQRVCT